jgi:transglutaminase-like putative cysteine protease
MTSTFHAYLPALLIVWSLCASPALAADPPPDLNETVALVPPAYRHKLVQRLSLAEQNRDALIAAVAKAPPDHREALAFLLVNMPEPDLKSLGADFLLRNVELAHAARERTPWAKAVPEELFLNDVLPYANLNEHREDWRADFVKRFAPLVEKCGSTGEAAQVLNRAVFPALKVAYHATKRRKPDQSPSESAEIGYASCSGLSIILADACRAVGVPARVVGTPLWADGSGNHTWVEAWDGRQWRFVGAAEPGEFDKTWFADVAAMADAARPETRIFAASFRQTGVAFPMVWDPTSKDYPAVDVTRYYVHRRTLRVTVADAAGRAAPDAGVSVRQAGRLIGWSPARDATFTLAADADYVVEAALAAGRSVAGKARLSADADATVDLRAASAPAGQ